MSEEHSAVHGERGELFLIFCLPLGGCDLNLLNAEEATLVLVVVL